MEPSFISIKKFVDEPYSEILGYPKATSRQIKSRISELEKLKIKNKFSNLYNVCYLAFNDTSDFDAHQPK